MIEKCVSSFHSSGGCIVDLSVFGEVGIVFINGEKQFKVSMSAFSAKSLLNSITSQIGKVEQVLETKILSLKELAEAVGLEASPGSKIFSSEFHSINGFSTKLSVSGELVIIFSNEQEKNQISMSYSCAKSICLSLETVLAHFEEKHKTKVLTLKEMAEKFGARHINGSFADCLVELKLALKNNDSFDAEAFGEILTRLEELINELD